ncbi:MAG: hypothetical protein GXP62_12210 [Oligoflexia bacterium]|nr:hypothetical protein [Oligoflexia bacterium]
MRTSSFHQATAWALTLSMWTVTGGIASAAPGDHIGSDDTQIIPAVELGAFHRTNSYLQEGVAGGGSPVVGGTALVLSPSLGIRAKNSDLIFSFDLLYQARKYLESRVINLDRFNDVSLNSRLDLFPDGQIGFRVGDKFSVSGHEAEDPDGLSASAYQQHLVNDLGAYVSVHPGGPLELNVGGRLQADKWDVPPEFKASGSGLDLVSSLTGADLNTRIGYGPSLRGEWRFFPKTAVVGEFDYQWFNWADNIVDAQGDNVSGDEVGDYLGIPDGKLWRAKTGLRGRVTPKLVVGVLAGFGQAIYDEASVTNQATNLGIGGSSEFADSVGFGSDLKSFPAGLLAEVEGKYDIVKDQSVKVSYGRDFQDVYFTNYVSFDRVLAAYEGLFARRFGVNSSFLFRNERYIGEVTRTDNVLQVDLGLKYLVQDYLTVNLGTGWQRRASADGAHPEIEYDDFRVQGGVGFTY